MKSEQTYVSRIIMLVMSGRWKISLTGAAKYSYQSIFGEYNKARRQHLRFQALIFGNSMRFFLSPSTSKSNCIRDIDDEA